MCFFGGDEATGLAKFEALHVDRKGPSFAALCHTIIDAQIASSERRSSKAV